ncbi:MAG: DHH family phosphoesterase [Planctomycetota bacterium]|jgi:nanoRNase/pAp phosphatase (c-di-AMP/oligoRNAs hydrolase)
MEARAIEGQTSLLLERLRGRRRLLVLTHANPDPDSLASAMGLRHLAEHLGVPSTFAIAGRIMRAENREMVRACAIETVCQDDVDFGAYDCIALVDTQPGFGHTHLPADRDIEIVIDHHVPPADGRNQGPADGFRDVRTSVGATSSMVTGYLMDAEVEISTRLATALFYGIQTDTADLSRNSSPTDVRAYEHLAPLVDRLALRKINTPQLTPDYYRTLREALNNVRIYGDLVLCSLGKIDAPEMVAEVADLLLRLEGKQTVFCGGLVGSTYYVSLRTELSRDAYDMLRDALDGEGSFGGHGSLAGGCVPLPDSEPRTVKRFERRLEKNILDSLGLEGTSLSGFGGRASAAD